MNCDFCNPEGIGSYDDDECDHCHGTGECPNPYNCGCREWQVPQTGIKEESE